MNKFLFIFIALFSLSSHAMPAVGDFVRFKVVISAGDTIETLVEELKLVDYDAPSDVFLLEQTLYMGTQKDIENIGVLKSDLMDEKNLASVLKNCQLGHGVLEKVSYKSESMDSCKFEVKSDEKMGHRWYGVVPFGIVKDEFVMKDGTKLTKQLIDYGFGK